MKGATSAIGAAGLLVCALLSVVQAGAAPEEGRRRARPVVGRVTAKGENTLDVQAMRFGAAGGEAVKVTLGEETQYSKFEAGEAADLKEGYLVSVLGTRQEAKTVAQGIIRLDKVEGEAKPEQVQAVRFAGMLLARSLGIQLWRQGQGIDAARRPVVGKIVATEPLTVETIPFRAEDKAEKVEVQSEKTTRILRQVTAKLDDIAKDALVAITPKEEAPANQVTARVVVLLPAPQEQGGGDQAK